SEHKLLTAAILEVWDEVEGDLDTASPFYRSLVDGVVSVREELALRTPTSAYTTQEILFNPKFEGTATEADLFEIRLLDPVRFLRYSYQFVRLLKGSTQTPAVQAATQKIETMLDNTLRRIGHHVDLDALRVVGCDAIRNVQLGSGLIVLNAMLEGAA